jgi:acyl-CoA dehydrogenase
MAPRAWPEAEADVIAPVAEHDELRQVVRQMLDKMAGPERVRAAAESERGYAPDLWCLLHDELEIGALAVPERLGGHGFGLRELAVILEETGAALLPEPILSSSVLGCQALAAAEDPARVSALLAAVMAGDRILAVALDGDPLELRSESDGHAASGRIPRLAHGALADHLVAIGATPQGPVLVLAETAACKVTPLTCLDGTRPQAEVRLDGTPVTVLVGAGQAAEVIARLRAVRDVAVAAEHAGMTTRLLEMLVGYARQREQFGRQIGSFQAVKHRVADVLVDRERALSAVRYAAAVLDMDPAGAAVPVAVAASVCTDAVIRTVHETVQLHGGIGFTWEHPAHLYVRRALGDEGLYGDSRQHRRRLAELLGL